MSHANAALTPKARLKLARLVVEDGWPIARAAERFQVSWPTAKRWAERYRQCGEAGMQDRCCRPGSQPNRTPQPLVRKIVHLRWKQRLGPVLIADRLGMAASTVHAVLVRCRLNRLSHVDRCTGEPVRRFEHDTPGALLHVDVKKLGNIPDGGGWRYVGRAQGEKNRSATAGVQRNKHRNPVLGTAFVHRARRPPGQTQSRRNRVVLLQARVTLGCATAVPTDAAGQQTAEPRPRPARHASAAWRKCLDGAGRDNE